MNIKIYQADAFADELFRGNPAAVCPLDGMISDEMMQLIAAENNLSETAYIFDKDGVRNIRWFTPSCEVALCGHATLASAHILFNEEGFNEDVIEFMSKSGILRVSRKGEELELDFPVAELTPCETDPRIEKSLGIKPLETYTGTDILAVFENENDIKNFKPDFRLLAELESRCVIVTAKGSECDFVSRVFGPAVGIDEDPVTGSAHCILTPYWAEKLGKKKMNARQISPRGGKLTCTLEGDRVKIAGKSVTYLKGMITV
jgi:PhzF family phenazine biosynthesis protein